MVAGLLLAGLIGDYVYSRQVAARIRAWEAEHRRDPNGVLEGCQAFATGAGEEVILLIHGINDSPAVWKRMAPGLAASGRRVEAMRLPGFAQPLEQYANCSMEDWTNAVDAEVQRLASRHRRVHLVCHSLGAAIALRWLQDHPADVDSITLLCPAIEVSNQRSPLLPVRWWHRISSGLVFTRTVWSPWPPDLFDPELSLESTRTPFTPRRVIAQTFALIDANREMAERIRIPVLMVLSRKDQVIDWQAAEAFHAGLRCDPARLCYQDQSGHVVPMDLGWETTTASIIGFLDQLPGAERAGDGLPDNRSPEK